VKRVVGVHGIGNAKHFKKTNEAEAAGALTRQWQEDIEIQVDLRCAYYSHYLRRGTAMGEHLAPEEEEALVRWIEGLQDEQVTAQGRRTARARMALDWLTRTFGDGAARKAARFVREVEAYLSEEDSLRRQRSKLAVAGAVSDHRPDVVVAHSLGSVVAYETLWQYPALEVDLFLTIGSPLAMPGVVLDRVRPPQRKRPPGVRRWVNIADVGDLVAVPRGGLGNAFEGVEDEPEISIGDWDFHTAGAYLRAPEVRKHLS
jgi:hypothetical protein